MITVDEVHAKALVPQVTQVEKETVPTVRCGNGEKNLTNIIWIKHEVAIKEILQAVNPIQLGEQ